MLKIERPWTRQPQSASGVVLSHPRAAGLVAFIGGRNVFGRGALYPDDGVTLSSGRQGFIFDGFNTSRIIRTSIERVTPPFTVAFDFDFVDSTVAGQAFVSQGGAGSGGRGWSVNGLPGSPGGIRITFGGVADYSYSSSVTLGAYYRFAVVVTGNGGAARYYINGVFDSSRAVGTMLQPASTLTDIGAVHNGTDYVATNKLIAGNRIGNIALWRRALSDVEMRDDSTNPFTMLSRRIWVPVTAAPTGSTVTALLRQRSQFIGSGLR